MMAVATCAAAVDGLTAGIISLRKASERAHIAAAV